MGKNKRKATSPVVPKEDELTEEPAVKTVDVIDEPELPDDDDDAVKTPKSDDKPNQDDDASKSDDDEVGEFDFEKQLHKEKIASIVRGTLIGIVALAIACVLLCVIVYNTTPEGVVLDNVYASGIDMGGKTIDEVKAQLADKIKLDSDKITVVVNGDSSKTEYTLTSKDIGLDSVLEDTAESVYSYGRSGNYLKDAFARIGLLIKRHNVGTDVKYNDKKLRAKLDEIGKKVYGAIKPHQIVPQADGNVALVAGKDGFDENTDQAVKDIRAALDDHNYTKIEITLKQGHPLDLKFENVDGAVYCDPKDAYYTYEDGEVKIVDEVQGRFLNKSKVEPYIKKFNETHEETVFPFEVSEPELTAATLKEKLFSSVIGSYSSSYGGGNRGYNVALAASKLNGAIVMPGETFSFNNRVGPRTGAAGFKTAPEYQAGQSVTGYGGGTCQVSSTLYCAVLYAGLEIVARTEHMMAVSYMPAGLDATVAYGSLDFKFKNNTKYPIKITTSASSGGGRLLVNVTGTAYDPPQSVKLTSSGVSSRANGGTQVRNYRIFYDADGKEIKKEDLGLSVYSPHVSAGATEENRGASSGSSGDTSSDSSSSRSNSSSEGTSSASSSGSSSGNSTEASDDGGTGGGGSLVTEVGSEE